MTRSDRYRRLAALFSFFPLLWLAPPVFAQGLTFDEDDEVIESDDFQFDPDEDIIDSSGGEIAITGIVIPNDWLDAASAEALSEAIYDGLFEIPNVLPVDYVYLQDEFDIMGTELALECAFDPICLSDVGEDIAVDQIVIGRASPASGGNVEYILDLIDVPTRSVVRYRPITTEDNLSNLIEVTQRQLPLLFDIRQDNTSTYVEATVSMGQKVARWSCLGLGALALGGALIFGLDASSIEDEVDTAALLDRGQRDITQVSAQARIDEAKDSALLSNVFLGTGLALLAVSALLFLITPGSDIDTEAEEGFISGNDLVPTFSPTVTSDGGWGFSGSFRF